MQEGGEDGAREGLQNLVNAGKFAAQTGVASHSLPCDVPES